MGATAAMRAFLTPRASAGCPQLPFHLPLIDSPSKTHCWHDAAHPPTLPGNQEERKAAFGRHAGDLWNSLRQDAHRVRECGRASEGLGAAADNAHACCYSGENEFLKGI